MIRRLTMWLRALARRDAVESEMEREVRAHIELETLANLRAGMSPAEARRAALIAFGGVERMKEQVREERGTRSIESLFADLRYALRGFRRTPALTATVVLLIGLGIGANSAIFGMLYELLLAPLPYPNGERMVTLDPRAGGGGLFLMGADIAFIDRWHERTRATEQILVTGGGRLVVGDTLAGDTERLRGTRVGPG